MLSATSCINKKATKMSADMKAIEANEADKNATAKAVEASQSACLCVATNIIETENPLPPSYNDAIGTKDEGKKFLYFG